MRNKYTAVNLNKYTERVVVAPEDAPLHRRDGVETMVVKKTGSKGTCKAIEEGKVECGQYDDDFQSCRDAKGCVWNGYQFMIPSNIF